MADAVKAKPVLWTCVREDRQNAALYAVDHGDLSIKLGNRIVTFVLA